jgi:hypothetical protein
MVSTALAIRREGTTGFFDWGNANRASVSSKRWQKAYGANLQEKSPLVSNELSQAEELATGSFWEILDPEEVVVGEAERIPDVEPLKNLQDTANKAEEKLIVPQKVREHRRNKKLAEAVERLNKFANSLGTIEAAMHINLAKEALADSWKSIAEEDTEIRITIASLEGALQEKKWRDYTSEQVNTVISILTDCIDGRLGDLKSALKRLSILYKKGIDIYPSASEEDYVEEEEEI